MSLTNRRVAIIGTGLIGRSWSVIFASSGYHVRLYDVDEKCLGRAPELIAKDLKELCSSASPRGSLSFSQRFALISTHTSLNECLEDVCHVQECVYDNLSLKQQVWQQVDAALDKDNRDATLCSSSSVLLPSKIFDKATLHKDQCLVAHPINPPLHVRLVELVPQPQTPEEMLIRTRLLMDEIGQKPVVLQKEISGFALNRLQFAVLQEAFRLVHDGIMTPEDVDTVVSDGLGPRYAFMGPWMTTHLNAAGVGDYIEKYGPGIHAVSSDCQPLLPIQGEAVQQVIDSMMREVPLEKLDAKRQWRDRCLVELATIKEKLGQI